MRLVRLTSEQIVYKQKILNSIRKSLDTNDSSLLYDAADLGAKKRRRRQRYEKDDVGEVGYRRGQLVMISNEIAKGFSSRSTLTQDQQDMLRNDEFIPAILDDCYPDEDEYFIQIHDQKREGPLKENDLKDAFEIDVKDERKRTLLQKAAEKNAVEIVIACLELGADPNVVNDKGFTPLHAAAYGDQVESVAALLAAGADVSRLTKDGRRYTALHYAALNGYSRVVELLLDYGADPHQKAGKAEGKDAMPCYVDFDFVAEETAIQTALRKGRTNAALAMKDHRRVLETQQRLFALLAFKRPVATSSSGPTIRGIGGRPWLYILSYLRGYRGVYRFKMRPSNERDPRECAAIAALANRAARAEKLRRTNGVRTALASTCRRWIVTSKATGTDATDAKRSAPDLVAAAAAAAVATQWNVNDRVQVKVAGKWHTKDPAVVKQCHPDGTYDLFVGNEWSGFPLKNKSGDEIRRYVPSRPEPRRGGCALL